MLSSCGSGDVGQMGLEIIHPCDMVVQLTITRGFVCHESHELGRVVRHECEESQGVCGELLYESLSQRETFSEQNYLLGYI
jgi:hypothetical protein